MRNLILLCLAYCLTISLPLSGQDTLPDTDTTQSMLQTIRNWENLKTTPYESFRDMLELYAKDSTILVSDQCCDISDNEQLYIVHLGWIVAVCYLHDNQLMEIKTFNSKTGFSLLRQNEQFIVTIHSHPGTNMFHTTDYSLSIHEHTLVLTLLEPTATSSAQEK